MSQLRDARLVLAAQQGKCTRTLKSVTPFAKSAKAAPLLSAGDL